MIKKALFFILSFVYAFRIEAAMFHQYSGLEWFKDGIGPFDKLMLSLNAKRPKNGEFRFYIQVKINKTNIINKIKKDQWSPWIQYASWGVNEQKSVSQFSSDVSTRVHQDLFQVLNGQNAHAFRIKVETDGDATLEDIYSLHVYTNTIQLLAEPFDGQISVFLPVAGLSQMALDHPRHRDLCSPTSTTAVVRYLLNHAEIDPLLFADQSWDHRFDIYGNWVLNVAQASSLLGPSWNCWVEHLSGFQDIYHRLLKGCPVVVSVRGPLPGSALPYKNGHLLVVSGYDHHHQQVLCMDPAFPSDSETCVRYSLADFLAAWDRRGKVAYIFELAK
ncbi:MAG: C39 family peptidase [Parachlamydiaceae bacterium]